MEPEVIKEEEEEGLKCVICEAEFKYKCPGCERRTCSLICVKLHKEKFDCNGLLRIPSAPESVPKGSKYNEELFVKDYNFLESLNNQITKLESSNPEKSRAPETTRDPEKIKLFKKIQKVSKLSELRMLPEGFTRSKRNRSHLIDQSTKKDEYDNKDEPECKSSRISKISWTIDFIHHPTCKELVTLYDIPDDTPLKTLLTSSTFKTKPIRNIYLKNESRSGKGEKWREIVEINKTIGQILVGGRCFEYPQFGICFE